MNELTIELMAAVIATVLAPVIIAVITAPFLFSKTLVQTFIVNPFEFSQETLQEYIITTSKLYFPITLIWGLSLVILTVMIESPTEQFVNQFLVGVGLTAIVYGVIITKYPYHIREYIGTGTDFFLENFRQKLILHSLLGGQLLLLIGVFFGLLAMAQL